MKQPVYISAYLNQDTHKGLKYGMNVHEALYNINEIEVVEIQNHNNNVWCRDYMPIKASNGNLVQFNYAPSYMTGTKKWRERIPIAEKIHEELNLKSKIVKSEIILDGGAIDILGKKAILSDRVFRDNSERREKDIQEEIKFKLGLDQIIVIPQYPFDFTGHVDGLVRFIDEKRVVVTNLDFELKSAKEEENSYRRRLLEQWYYAFKYTLLNTGLTLEQLPSSIPENCPVSSAEGIYTNFLLLNDLIIMPSYNKPEDEIAKEKLSILYKKPVKPIYATDLAKQGGMINCVTWTK
mgnify:CR=1 FL=1